MTEQLPPGPTPNYRAIVQKIYADFDAGNFDGIVAQCAPDVVWIGYGPADFPTTGTFQGRDGVRQFIDAMNATFTFTAFTPGPMVAQGTTVMLTGTDAGTLVKTKVPFADNWTHVWEFKGTLVSRFREYLCDTQGSGQQPGGA